MIAIDLRKPQALDADPRIDQFSLNRSILLEI